MTTGHTRIRFSPMHSNTASQTAAPTSRSLRAKYSAAKPKAERRRLRCSRHKSTYPRPAEIRQLRCSFTAYPAQPRQTCKGCKITRSASPGPPPPESPTRRSWAHSHFLCPKPPRCALRCTLCNPSSARCLCLGANNRRNWVPTAMGLSPLRSGRRGWQPALQLRACLQDVGCPTCIRPG